MPEIQGGFMHGVQNLPPDLGLIFPTKNDGLVPLNRVTLDCASIFQRTREPKVEPILLELY